MASPSRRIAILAEGHFAPMEAKTAIGLLRYRPDEVVAVIDSRHAGTTTERIVGAGGGTPVLGTVADAAELGADTLLIGIAPAGGRLPAAWRSIVEAALDRGWRVVSGLHTFLADDASLAACARAHGAAIDDVRRPPAGLGVGLGRAAHVEALVVLTVGTDCNVGKMTTSLEVQRALRERGVRAAFVATGQTGIMIAGAGVAVDAVPADFIAGSIEPLVLAAARDHDVVLVEGQGSLHHPSFSGVTLGLLHGCCPAALVLCHHHGRARIRVAAEFADDGPALRPLAESRDAALRAAAWVSPAALAGIALNTWDTPEPAARAACAAAAAELGVPATDPVRFGAGPLADVLVAAWRARRDARPVTTSREAARATDA
jgi:uncharacterized NAD-dependent epimerase/dehydratase family protein